jgi:hypothetical protein
MDNKDSHSEKQMETGERSIPGNIRVERQGGIPLLILFASLAFLFLFFLAQSGGAAQEIVHEARSVTGSAGSPAYGVDFITSAELLADEQQIGNGLATGAGWDRWPIYWFYVETSEGIFDWTRQDAAVRDDLDHGLQLNAILLGTPAFYTTSFLQQPSLPYRHSPRQGPLSLNSVEAAKPLGLYEPVFLDGDNPGSEKVINPNGVGVTHWEMWNEPDLPFFWDSSLADYARLLKVGYLAANHADPEAQVMFGGLVMWRIPDYYDQVLDIFAGDSLAKSTGYFHDIVAIHNYFKSERSRDYVEIVSDSMTDHGLNKQIWLNESGVPAWDDYPGPVWEPLSALRASQREQADFAIQSAFYAISAGADALFHFQLYDGCGNQPAGTDFPPHNGELCDADNNYNGKPCAGDANGLYRNPTDAACFTQHPQPETARPVFSAYQVLTTYVHDIEPYWQKRAGTPLYTSTCPGSDGPQEWIALYQPSTKKRIVGLWTRCGQTETAVIEATDPNGKAQLVAPDGSVQEITAVNGSYTISLPGATNRNPFPGQTINATYPIGGRPYILIETDYRGEPPTPTATSTTVASSTPTATIPPACEQVIINGGFEDDNGWRIPITPYQARYSVVQAHTGSRSMRAGIVDPQDNRLSYSTALQKITIPLAAENQILHVQLFPLSTEPASLTLPTNPLAITEEEAASSGDAQIVLLLDVNGQVIESLLVDRRNDETWMGYSFDLSHRAGETVQIYFGVYNNGSDGVTGMYIDDVSLGSCASATPTPTATATATKKPPTNVPYTFFTPMLFNDYPLGISGKIIGAEGQGVEAVKINTDRGHATLSEQSGHYGFNNLDPGTYIVWPEKDGYIFQPQMRELTLPPGAPLQNFLAIPPTPTPGPYPGP